MKKNGIALQVTVVHTIVAEKSKTPVRIRVEYAATMPGRIFWLSGLFF